MKLFGREPTLWIAALNALVMMAGTFGFRWFSFEQAGLLVALINAGFAALNAWTVRPISPVVFTYLTGAALALLSSYGLNFTNEQVAMLNAAIIPFLSLASRGQVAPQNTAVSESTRSTGGTVTLDTDPVR